jgi:predicted permease
LDLSVDGRVLGFTAGVAILSGLVFGLAPAWRGTLVPPQSAMKANGRGVVEGSKFGLGKALVTLQVALSLVLVTGAGLMMSTFFKLSAVDTGFDRDRVLLVQVDLRKAGVPAERRSAAFEQIMDSFRAIPGVRSVSGSDNTPISGNTWSGDVAIDGDQSRSSASTHVYFNQVSSRFFETLGTPLMAGRDFDDHDTLASPKVAIVNQSMATRLFGNENPLGKHFRAVNTGSTVGDREIVGVVRDAKYSDLREAAPPTAYIALTQDQNPGPFCNFEIRASTGHPSALIPAVNSMIAKVNRDAVLQFTPLATQVGESISRERLLATLSGFFGGLALLLAMIGLYGVMSNNVARRRNEIGIRMALGAERSSVLRMVLGEVAVVVGIGLAIGLSASLGTARFIASFLYGMKANDPWTLGAAAGALAAIAVLAGFIPARRASRLDPMTALREE